MNRIKLDFTEALKSGGFRVDGNQRYVMEQSWIANPFLRKNVVVPSVLVPQENIEKINSPCHRWPPLCTVKKNDVSLRQKSSKINNIYIDCIDYSKCVRT